MKKVVNGIFLFFCFFSFVFAEPCEIKVSSSVSNLEYNNIQNNGNGGIFYVNGGNLTLNDVSFSSNTAKHGGAIYNKKGTVMIGTETIFNSNKANTTLSHGGAIYNQEEVIVGSGTLFNSNMAKSNGGAIYSKTGTVTIGTGTIFKSNEAGSDGGAIYNNNKDGIVTIESEVKFSSNIAGTNGDGGAICNRGKVIVEEGVVFDFNKAGHDGGAIDNGGTVSSVVAGTVTINSGVLFYSNGADHYGGAICNKKGTVNIGTGTIFTSNNAGYGGAIFNDQGGIVTIEKDTLFNSNVAGYGGAINNGALDNIEGVITIGERVEFNSNRANYYGGVINNRGKINIDSLVTFSSNTAGKDGGAICNRGEITIGSGANFNYNIATSSGGAILNDGEVTIGYETMFSSNTANYGGAIYNDSGTVTVEQRVKFSSNKTNNYGGAIFNNQYGKVTIEEGVEFSSNTANNQGGAIFNKGETTIGYLSIFNSNEANYGGAIYNNQNGRVIIEDEVEFSSNIAKNYGGAIYNQDQGEVNIGKGAKFNFNKANRGGAIFNQVEVRIGEGVKFSSNRADFYGGAIYNNQNGKITIEEGVEFCSNSASTYGGAIDNRGKVTIESGVEFSSNTSNLGGAIYNYNKSTMTISGNNITFNYNTATSSGGAIFNNRGEVTIESGAIFNSNNANNAGGAIYNNGTLNLIVNTEKIEFTGNTANGVSNAIYDNEGIINLYAKNEDIIFNDRIASKNNKSILNINQSTTALIANGKIILNEDMSGFTGQVNIYDGELELQARLDADDINKNKFFSGDINFSSGTLNISNGTIDYIDVKNWTSTENSNLKFDVDLRDDTSDNFTVENEATGELNLTAINILGTSFKSTGTITLFKDEKSPEFQVLTTAYYDGYEYSFSTTTVMGELEYNVTGTTKTFKEVVNDTAPVIRSYSFANDEIVTLGLEDLGGDRLTIFGNGYEVISSSVSGINISTGQILEIDKGSGDKFVWRNFYSTGDGGVLNNTGIVDIGEGIEFDSNEAHNGGAIFNSGEEITVGSGAIFNYNIATSSGGAIHNKGKLTIESESVFNSNTAKYGGAIYNDKGTITIEEGVEFNSNIANDSGGAIYNSNDSAITISGANIAFSSNTAKYSGGAIYNNTSTITISGENITFDSNTATYGGGVIYNNSKSSMEIISAGQIDFNSNIANSGGVIYNNNSIIAMNGRCIFFSSNNVKQHGGALYNYDNSKMEIDSTETIVFSSNTATGNGGALYNFKNSTMMMFSTGTVNFCSNTANNGGAIYNNNKSTMTIRGNNIIFDYNTATSSGGAIYNNGSTLNLVSTGNMEFTGNTANGVSNAIYDNKGIINLYANENTNIVFNDRIISENSNSTLNVNQSTTTFNAIGTIILNEDMSGYTGEVNLYAGEVKLKEGNKFFNTSNFTIHGGTLTANASDILKDFTNNGNVRFIGGQNNNEISGEGNLEVLDKFINNGLIKNKTITFKSVEVSSIFTEEDTTLSTKPIQKEIVNNSIVVAEKINLDSVILKLRQAGSLQVDNLNVIKQSTLDLCNGKIEEQRFNKIDLEENLNMVLDDIDLENKKMDTIESDTVSNTGKIEINEIALLNDGKEKVTEVGFTKSDGVKDKITNNVPQVATLNYVYDVKYNEQTGEMIFTKKVGAGRLSLIGEYVNQISVVEQAFASIDHCIKDKKKENKDKLLLSKQLENGFWIRGYGGKEDTNIDNNKIDNTNYGALAGVDLISNENIMYSIYLGYNNSKQEYEDVLRVDHNGYVFGLSAMIMKDNWFLGLTGNIGYKNSKVENNKAQEATENFITYTGAIKIGYDLILTKGLELQPNAMLMYMGVNAIGYEEEVVDTKGLNDLIAEPGIKLKLDVGKGWKPYIFGAYAFNMGKVVVENKDMNIKEDKGIDNYAEYGGGIEKLFSKIPLSVYLTAKGRSGGRNGYNGYTGIKWSFGNRGVGKEKKKVQEEKLIQEQDNLEIEKNRKIETKKENLEKEHQKSKEEVESLNVKEISLEEAKTLKKKKVKDIKLKNQPTFVIGTAKLTKEGKEMLKGVAEELKNYPEERLLIEGYTDDIGDKELNQKLSEERATAIAITLINVYGVRNSISSVGKGETEPVVSNDTSQGRAKNRRVEFTIISAK